MRRPRFYRWIRSETMELAHTTSFNLRKMAARAQRDPSEQLAAAVLLYAHENDCVERLLSYVYDQALLEEYRLVEQRLGARSVERLALRGTPVASLPERYRLFLSRFADAYHAPELIAREKRQLRDAAYAATLRTGTSPTELARALDLDPSNVSAFLVRGDTSRFTLETARAICTYVA